MLQLQIESATRRQVLVTDGSESTTGVVAALFYSEKLLRSSAVAERTDRTLQVRDEVVRQAVR